MRFATFIPVFALAATITMAGSPALAERVSEHGNWTVFKEKDKGSTMCFLSSQPTKSQGKYKKRGDIYAIVSHFPAEKLTNEVGFQAGYTLKKGSDATVSIDSKAPFKLFTDGEGAWAYDKKSDIALVAAMKKGTAMVVRGVSARGTKTTDTYSLRGFTAAHGASLKACKIK